jgi:hypothetical protein
MLIRMKHSAAPSIFRQTIISPDFRKDLSSTDSPAEMMMQVRIFFVALL